MGSNEEYLDKLLKSVTNEEKPHEETVHEYSQDMSDEELLESLIEMYSEELAEFKETEIIHKEESDETNADTENLVTEEIVVSEETNSNEGFSLDDLLGTSAAQMSEFENGFEEETVTNSEEASLDTAFGDLDSESEDYLSQDDIEALLSNLQDDLPSTTSEIVNEEKIVGDFSANNDEVLSELLSEPQTIDIEDVDLFLEDKDAGFGSSEDDLLKDMGIDNMSAEQIDALLNAAAENEKPNNSEMDMNALFGEFGFNDDFDPEHNTSEDMADLLGGMLGGNDDLGGNDLLNELLNTEEDLKDSLAEAKEEKTEGKTKKVKKEKIKKEKVKKEKVKKEKGEKQPKVKKEGESFWKKLTSVLFEEEDSEENNKVKIVDGDELDVLMNADDNDAILAEMMKEDKQKDKKSKKKDKKKADKKGKDVGENEDGEEVIDPKEAAKQAKLKEKAEKKAAKKKEKKEKAEADRAFLKAQPSISTKRAMVAVFFSVSILVIVLVLYKFAPVAIEKASARKAFYKKNYYEAYELLQGKELNDSDSILLNKVTTILKMQRKLDSYNNYVKMDKQIEALNSLMEAVVLYEQNAHYAKALSIDAEYDALYDQVLLNLNGRYGVSEDLAKEINACISDAEYTVRLYYIIEGMTWGSVEEENSDKPMEDVLPEEEEFLEGQ